MRGSTDGAVEPVRHRQKHHGPVVRLIVLHDDSVDLHGGFVGQGAHTRLTVL